MSLRDEEVDVVAVLEEVGLGSTTSTPPTLYAGPIPGTAPDELFSVQNLGGGENAEQLLGGGGRVAMVPEVTVRHRGAREGTPGAYANARAAAAQAWEALWARYPEGYVRWVPQGTGPTYLGVDPEGRHLHSFTVLCEHRATTSTGVVTPDE
jgi:hypothetical protein